METQLIDVDDMVDALRAFPLRDRMEIWKRLTQNVFSAAAASVVEWGDDPELSNAGETVDEELAHLAQERRALEDLTVTAVEVARSAEASVRALAAHHDRVVTRSDADRWAEHPAGFTPGEFAADGLAVRAGVSAGTAASWAATGDTLRSRHPELWSLAGEGRVRVSTCEAVVDELSHLTEKDASRVERLFLSGRAIFAGPVSVRRRLRRLLGKLGLARPRDEVHDADLHLSFNEVPEQPALTELHVVLPADDAWRLHTAIEARADALTQEHADLHAPGTPYPRQRARVDALIDLALGNIRFSPVVTINVPVMPTVRVATPVRGEATPHALEGPTTPLAPSGAHVMREIPTAGNGVGPHAPHVCPSDASSASPSTPRDTAIWSIADVTVPNIGTISGETIAALGTTLGAQVRTSLTDATSGITAWSASRTYRPGLAMRRFVEERDQHCRFPGCMRPASFCDADHVTPHAEGGATSPANLQLLCRHHHRAKTVGGWAVALTADAAAIWQSPTGQWYRTLPGDATAYPLSTDEGLRAA